MNLLHISLRNLRIRILSSTLTMISIALGTALVAAIWLMIDAADKHYKSSLLGYKAVVGPKEGAPMALVLSAVLNLGSSQGVVPLSVYRELHDGRLGRRFGLRYAIPQARGDQYAGFPLVGTTDEMFSLFRRGKDAEGAPRTLKFAAGGPFEFGHADLLQFAEEVAKRKAAAEAARNEVDPAAILGAEQPDQPDEHAGHDHGPGEIHFQPKFFSVLGAKAAAKTGLRLGDHFLPVHGGADEVGAHVHEESACKIVGILEATGSPIDRSIFMPLSGFLSFEGHEEAAMRATPEEAKADHLQISAIIVDTRDHLGGNKLRYEFQTRRDAQVAWPQIELANLRQWIGDIKQLLVVVSWLVIAVAAISILVSLYNTMNERRREIAIMRSLGARRAQIIRIIISEAFLVSSVGGVLGIGICHAATFAFHGIVESKTSVPLDWTNFSVAEAYLVLAVAILGSIAGILPAIKGSTTPVAENLGPTF